MPYDSASGAYIRRTTTILDETPDGDTVNTAVAGKLDTTADDSVTDINHHRVNGGHYPAPSVSTVSRYLKQTPAGDVTWGDGVPIDQAALKDLSNVPAGTTAGINITGNAATATSAASATSATTAAACTGNAATATLAAAASDMASGHALAGKTTAEAVRTALGVVTPGRGFSAVKSASQSGIAPSTNTKITFPTEEYDTHGWYDPATSRFAPTEAGYYLVLASLSYAGGMSDANPCQIKLYKNGSSICLGTIAAPGVVQTVPVINRVVYMDGIADYLEIYAFATGAGDKLVASDQATYFQAHRV